MTNQYLALSFFHNLPLILEKLFPQSSSKFASSLITITENRWSSMVQILLDVQGIQFWEVHGICRGRMGKNCVLNDPTSRHQPWRKPHKCLQRPREVCQTKTCQVAFKSPNWSDIARTLSENNWLVAPHWPFRIVSQPVNTTWLAKEISALWSLNLATWSMHLVVSHGAFHFLFLPVCQPT